MVMATQLSSASHRVWQALTVTSVATRVPKLLQNCCSSLGQIRSGAVVVVAGSGVVSVVVVAAVVVVVVVAVVVAGAVVVKGRSG